MLGFLVGTWLGFMLGLVTISVLVAARSVRS